MGLVINLILVFVIGIVANFIGAIVGIGGLISIPFSGNIYSFIRVQKPITKLFGPRYLPNHKYISIDITYHCNLKCINCNRSCGQAPCNDQMTVKQIYKFVKESINNNVKWEEIRILGGEPTLHPNVLEILNLLLKYKNNYSSDTIIRFVTNGIENYNIISKIPKKIRIQIMPKKDKVHHIPFNVAPKDSRLYKYANYSNGCLITSMCGIGLTPYGYYPCAIAGGIDRIFGFNIGRKKLPSSNDSMIDQLQVFCRLCGHFRYPSKKLFMYKVKHTNNEILSPTWKKAYKKYKIKKPLLSLY